MAQDDLSPFGHPKGQMVNGTWVLNKGPVASRAALAALAATLLEDCDVRVVTADESRWRYDALSTLTDVTSNLVIQPSPGGIPQTTGRWIRVDPSLDIKLPIGFGTADATVLFTVPAGMRLRVAAAYYEVITSFTGGSASAIGLSSNQVPHDTAGDLLGGTTGDVAATLVSTNDGVTQGTIGASFSAAPKMVVLEAGSTVKFNAITSAFTAGAGFVHLAAAQVI